VSETSQRPEGLSPFTFHGEILEAGGEAISRDHMAYDRYTVVGAKPDGTKECAFADSESIAQARRDLVQYQALNPDLTDWVIVRWRTFFHRTLVQEGDDDLLG